MSTDHSDLQKAAGSMKIMGVLTIIFGSLAIAMPWIAGQSILLMIGILVMAGGLTRMIWAFRAGSLGRGILVFLIGVLTLLAGVAILSHPLLTSGLLTILLAVYFLIDGASELAAAFSMPGGQAGKGWLIFAGLISILLGFALFTGFPLAGTLAIGVLVGIKLLLVGMTMLTLGSAVKRAI